MLEPDFTPLPVFSAVADYATGSVAPPPLPAWQYNWMSARPALFLFGAAVVFFALLRALVPARSE
mgnify:FL=1